MLTRTAEKFFGNRAKLAAALGITRAATHQWGERVPIRRQYELERLTNGALKATVPPALRRKSLTPRESVPDANGVGRQPAG